MQLIQDYATMRTRIEDGLKALREESKRKLKEDAALLRREHKTVFGIQLNKARDGGMKRADLLEVIGTQDGNKLKEFVELGGGQMRRVKTGDERIAEELAAQAAAHEDYLAEQGVEYLGFIFPNEDWRELGEKKHVFSVIEIGGQFYFHAGHDMPHGENKQGTLDWLNAHRDVVKQLQEKYPEGVERE